MQKILPAAVLASLLAAGVAQAENTHINPTNGAIAQAV